MARKKLYYLKTDKISSVSKLNEWMLEDGTPYTGPYHRYKSTNEVFTEFGYIDNVSKKLLPFKNLNILEEKSILNYNNLTKNLFNTNYKKPTPFKPIIRDIDYAKIFFKRYVVYKVNTISEIIEVSPKTFEDVDPVLYIKKDFDWRITKLGTENIQSVIDSNKKTINSLKVFIPKIDSFLTNLVEFSI